MRRTQKGRGLSPFLWLNFFTGDVETGYMVTGGIARAEEDTERMEPEVTWCIKDPGKQLLEEAYI